MLAVSSNISIRQDQIETVLVDSNNTNNTDNNNDTKLQNTAINDEDSIKADGWSIANGSVFKNADSSGDWDYWANSKMIKVNGTINATVPENWSLKPSGLGTGDSFRLLFLTSTKSPLTSSDIATYNTFVQNRAAAGHAAIQSYSSLFKVVGSTAAVDARDNTGTTGTGVPIYWLNGNKVADNYADFYDGSWDDEANNKTESGVNTLDTTLSANQPATGSNHNGTESFQGTSSRALGASNVRIGRPNVSGQGPLQGSAAISNVGMNPVYALSDVLTVEADPTPPTAVELSVGGSGTIITIEFDEPLDFTNTATKSNFGVTADERVLTINAFATVSGSDNKAISLFFVGDNVITQGETVEVTYTDPTTGDDANALQDDDGNDVATFTQTASNGSNITPPDLTEESVSVDWSLIPEELGGSDSFRLIFVSSTSRDAVPTGIATYNTFIQDRAAAGHTDIQTYASQFRVVGSNRGHGRKRQHRNRTVRYGRPHLLAGRQQGRRQLHRLL